MRLTKYAVLFIALLAMSSVGRASIIGLSNGTVCNSPSGSPGGWCCHDDGDGAVKCAVSDLILSNSGDYSTTITGTQCWTPGHVIGDVTTDSDSDPTLILTNLINNDTSFAWTAYDVTVSMANTFTLSNATPLLPNTWTVATIQPVLIGGQYVGHINFSDVPPVAIGDNFEFQYFLSFGGATSYSFTQTMEPVPEPLTFALLGAAVLGLIAFRRQWKKA